MTLMLWTQADDEDPKPTLQQRATALYHLALIKLQGWWWRRHGVTALERTHYQRAVDHLVKAVEHVAKAGSFTNKQRSRLGYELQQALRCLSRAERIASTANYRETTRRIAERVR